jgi:hypothetical protein
MGENIEKVKENFLKIIFNLNLPKEENLTIISALDLMIEKQISQNRALENCIPLQ